MCFEEFLFCVYLFLIAYRISWYKLQIRRGLHLSGLILQCDEMSLQLTLLISLPTAYCLSWMNYLIWNEKYLSILCVVLSESLFWWRKKVQDMCWICSVPCSKDPVLRGRGTLTLIQLCQGTRWVIPIQNKVFNNSFDCRSKTLFCFISHLYVVCLLLVRKDSPQTKSFWRVYKEIIYKDIEWRLEKPMRVVVLRDCKNRSHCYKKTWKRKRVGSNYQSVESRWWRISGRNYVAIKDKVPSLLWTSQGYASWIYQ